MKKQTIMWTALPNGMITASPEGGARLRLSVFVSPRLQTNEGLPRPRLSQFPDLLDWPAKVAQMSFEVQFNTRPSVAAQRVAPAAPPAPSDLWKSIFGSDTYVEPYEFPGLDKSVVRSFSVKNVTAHLKAAYQNLAVESPTLPPQLEVGPNVRGAGNLAPVQRLLADIAPPPQQAVQLRTQMDGHLRVAKAIANPVVDAVAPGATRVRAMKGVVSPRVAPNVSQAARDFNQLQVFHGRLPAGRVARPVRPVRVPILVPQMDFHDIVSSLGEYPDVMKRLGLVVELEVPFESFMLSTSWVRVIPQWEPALSSSSDVTPKTRCSVTAKDFRAVPGPHGQDLNDGMLGLDDADRFEVGQVDVDGAAMKTVDLADALREGTGETDAAVPSLRSAGIWVAKTNRAHEFAVAVLTRTRVLETAVQRVATTQALRGRPGRTLRLGLPGRRTPVKKEDEIELYAEDLVRGYRVDIWDGASDNWHSLCERVGDYVFEGADGAAGHTLQITDEGCISMAATQAADDSSDDLYLHELLFRWEGWSLAASRPGLPVPQSGVPQSTGNDYGLQVDFAARPGSLPRLRFGHEYRVRARAVDLAGNSLAPDEAGDTAASEVVRYSRQEPVGSPAVVPRTQFTDAPGESVDRIVIRSYNDDPAKDTVPTSEVSQRHVAPPKTSQIMAETHGMFDGPQGMLGDPATYNMIVNKDASLAEFYDVDRMQLPYLPDPLALGAVVRFRSLEADGESDETVRVPFDGDWPQLQTFRIQVVERTNANSEPRFDTARRVLLIPLEKAETAEVWLSCYMPERTVPEMGVWRWTVEGIAEPAIRQARLPAREAHDLRRQLPDMRALPRVQARAGLKTPQVQLIAKLNRNVVRGICWMVTPSRQLRLVHAVQQPLVTPEFRTLKATKRIGQTFARLSDVFDVDGKSTAQVDMHAEWDEPIDNIAEPEPKVIRGDQHVFELAVEEDQSSLSLSEPLRLAQIRRQPGNIKVRDTGPVGARKVGTRTVTSVPGMAARPFLPTLGRRHEFGDTKYRKVTYCAEATTRFREYLPFSDEDIEEGRVSITRKSQKVAVDILSSARPAAPKLLYVIPTFGWQQRETERGVVNRRKGGGLRVYLERPWYSSGDGELLGVVLMQPRQMQLTAMVGPMAGGIPNTLKPYVTQWGQDPIWRTAGTKNLLTAENFGRAVAAEKDLSLDEVAGARVAVAGHQVGYDPARQLWYCDIEIDPGEAYFPFVRMALARYQPKSVKNAGGDVKLSRVVLADFAQLAPGRSASLTFDQRDRQKVNVSVFGPTYAAASSGKAATVEVTVEQRRPEVDGDLGWAPVPKGIIELSRTGRTGSGAWRGTVELPAERGSAPFRLVIREYEWLESDSVEVGGMLTRAPRPVPRGRLVYADTLEI